MVLPQPQLLQIVGPAGRGGGRFLFFVKNHNRTQIPHSMAGCLVSQMVEWVRSPPIWMVIKAVCQI